MLIESVLVFSLSIGKKGRVIVNTVLHCGNLG
jgi:hypothetical protein